MCLSAAAIPCADGALEAETYPSEDSLIANTNNVYSEEDNDNLVNMTKLYDYLDTIEYMTRPGCPSEILNVALESMSQIVINLSLLASSPSGDLISISNFDNVP